MRGPLLPKPRRGGGVGIEVRVMLVGSSITSLSFGLGTSTVVSRPERLVPTVPTLRSTGPGIFSMVRPIQVVS